MFPYMASLSPFFKYILLFFSVTLPDRMFKFTLETKHDIWNPWMPITKMLFILFDNKRGFCAKKS